MTPKRSAVIGTGYVGMLVAASSVGHQVVGVESDQAKLALHPSGIVPFREPGIGERSKRRRPTTAAVHRRLRRRHGALRGETGPAGGGVSQTADLSCIEAGLQRLVQHDSAHRMHPTTGSLGCGPFVWKQRPGT